YPNNVNKQSQQVHCLILFIRTQSWYIARLGTLPTHRNNSYSSPTALPHETIYDYLTIQRLNNTDRLGFGGSYVDENPFCAPNIDITNYLNLHSYNKHDDFCLAYIFTYRDFSGGTLGLAWVAELSGSGGVCEKHRQMREGNQNVHKSLNTGVVTLLNYGSQVALKVSQLTFAHEVGHNFGANATSGDKENNNKFSSCSLDSIARLLDRVLWVTIPSLGTLHQYAPTGIRTQDLPVTSSDGAFCGNQLIEEGEECDCGFTKASCRDKCCHPKDSSTPCKLVNSVQCSPTAGVCCTENCQYRPETHMCRPAGECHRASNCSGKLAKCPPVDILPDGTLCQVNIFRKLCMWFDFLSFSVINNILCTLGSFSTLDVLVINSYMCLVISICLSNIGWCG
ncbi:unnamed protein product, partial [Trichobilharzia regenti]